MKSRPLPGLLAAIPVFALVLAPVLALAPAARADEAPVRPTVLITGANRGIGLEFARQLAARHWRVIATARDPAAAKELQQLAGPDLIVEPLDVADPDSVRALAGKYRGQPVDMLLLNAAMGPDLKSAMSPLSGLDLDQARKMFDVNALGPVRMCQAFMEHVAASRKKRIVVMSSDSGSIAGGSQRPILYNYKASKAALNMYMHNVSFETTKWGITLVMLHPGLVGTNPMLEKFPGSLKTADSVARMLTLIDALTQADNGRFIRYDGQPMPW